MDPKRDEPRMSMDTSKKTTQLNLWMVVGIIVFLVLAGIWVARVFRDPPDSTEEMRRGSIQSSRSAWV